MLELKLLPEEGFELNLKSEDGGAIGLNLVTELSPPVTLVLAPFFKGEKGIAGSPDFELVAGEAVGGHRIVVQIEDKAYYATNDNAQHVMRVLGMTRNAASTGDILNVVRSGLISEASWNLDVTKPVFLGVNGLITQTPPETAIFSLIVGFPTLSNQIFISIREPLVLGV